MNLKGKWKGEYTYGEGYPGSDLGRSVPFELVLVPNGIEFEGFFTDEESKDIFTEPGVLKGYQENGFINFSKWYPCYWQVTETGEVEVLRDTPSHEICHSGAYVTDHFEGEWEIPFYFTDDLGTYAEIRGQGTWSMWKV